MKDGGRKERRGDGQSVASSKTYGKEKKRLWLSLERTAALAAREDDSVPEQRPAGLRRSHKNARVCALAAALEGLLDLREIYEKDCDRKEMRRNEDGGDGGGGACSSIEGVE